jgi:squalene-associated FAD-dependent desaturase
MKVAVLGGGFAGLAAAIDLQERRHDVVLLERRGVLGGRATSYRDAVSGEDVDNGTHLMVGAYTATRDLMRRAGAEDMLLVQDNLRIDYRDDRGLSSLRCPPLTAPLHLLAGIAGLRLPWRARVSALRLFLAARLGKPPDGLTLDAYLAKTGQSPEARRLLWNPLATAILNETPERASALLFYNVFREAFLESRHASCLMFLRQGLGRLADQLARYLVQRGGVVWRRALAEGLELEGGRVGGVRVSRRAETRDDIRRGTPARPETMAVDAVVAAVPWHAVPELLPEEVRGERPFADLPRLGATAILSVEVWLDRVVVDHVMLGLRDEEMEWVFDKGRLFGRTGPPQHLAFIVSAARRILSRPNAELVAAAESALRRYFPPATITRSLVLREPEATFAARPENEALRPRPVTPIEGLYLAGDWTDTGLPATIEGAVRSGFRAAACVVEQALPGLTERSSAEGLRRRHR